MGLFSRNYIDESYDYNNSILNDSIDTPSKYDGIYDFTTESATRIIAENEINYTNIMKAVGISELAAFENGEDFFINEAGGFFESIINFFKNVWEKIKGIFRKFIAAFDSMTKSDKDFINKYKTYLNKSGVLKDFKYSGFKFTIKNPKYEGSISNLSQLKGGAESYFHDSDYFKNLSNDFDLTRMEATTKTKEDLQKDKDKFNDDWDDTILPKIREDLTASVLSGFNAKNPTAEELNQELFEFFRDGESSKTKLEESDISISDIILHLSSSENTKKIINKAYKTLNTEYDKIIKKFEKLSSNSIKAMPGTNLQNNNLTTDEQKQLNLDYINFASQVVSQVAKAHSDVITTINNAWLKAMNDRSKQEKAICVALVNRGTNVKHYGESFDFSSSTSSYLGNVKLI